MIVVHYLLIEMNKKVYVHWKSLCGFLLLGRGKGEEESKQFKVSAAQT